MRPVATSTVASLLLLPLLDRTAPTQHGCRPTRRFQVAVARTRSRRRATLPLGRTTTSTTVRDVLQSSPAAVAGRRRRVRPCRRLDTSRVGRTPTVRASAVASAVTTAVVSPASSPNLRRPVRTLWAVKRFIMVAEWLACWRDSGAEGPGFKSHSRRCRVTVLGKLFTPVVPLFTKQRNL